MDLEYGHATHLAGLRSRQLAGGVARADSDRRSGEVDISPSQPEQLATPKTRERGGQEDRRVGLRASGADERPDLLGREDLDVAAVAHPEPIDARDRIRRQAIELDRAPEDRVHQHQQVVLRLVRELALLAGARHARTPPLDLLHGDVLEHHLAEHRQQVDVDRIAVVADRRRLAAAVLL
jgi:hypothetical protein